MATTDGVVRLAYNPGPVNAYGALDGGPAVRLAVTTHSGSMAPAQIAHALGGQPHAPSVRLAYGNSPPERNGTSGLEAPSVRLAVTIDGGGACGPANMARNLGPPAQANARSVRLAYGDRAFEAAALAAPATVARPALLVSFVYLDAFLKHRARYAYRDWVLDSGAFSAHQQGTTIPLDRYIATCQQLLATDPTLTEVFALDVIGDWRASVRNTETMWAAGVPAIPCFHVGTPEDVLRGLARDYPKVALGGAVGYRAKDAWAAQCFARVWPARLHGFGFGSETSVLALPWHSVDATNWEIGPCKFGRWQSFGQMSVRGSKQDLRAEVAWYLALEARARVRWRREMAQLAALPTPWPVREAPTVRHEANGHEGRQDAKAAALGPVGRPAAQQGAVSQVRRSGLGAAE
jgi:hypothetical protein